MLTGRVRVPGDKSVGHRACIFSAISTGRSRLDGLGQGADVASTRHVLTGLGAVFEPSGEGFEIEGLGLRGLTGANGATLDCGNSGTTIRLLMGLLAGQPGVVRLDGDRSLRKRPMRRVSRVLEPFGAQIELPEGDRPPVLIRGTQLKGARIETGLASAQVKSAALLAGLTADGATEVIESGPSRDHTERILGALGVVMQREGLRTRIEAPSVLPAQSWRPPGDTSSAAFWLAAAALLPGSDLVLEDVGINDTRTGFFDVLRAMGVDLQVEQTAEWIGEPVGRLRVRGGNMVGAHIGGDMALRALDELPLVAVLGALAEGETLVTDAAELRVKESDRIEAMTAALRGMGARIESTPDGWHIEGVGGLTGAAVEVHDDHRIAMASLVAGLRASGPILLDDPGAAAVSYPEFPRALQAQVGGL